MGPINKLKVALNQGNDGPVLVTCADGVVAHRVALRLRMVYTNVRAGVKDLKSVPALSNAGAQVVHFDWEDQSTYKPALKNVSRVFIAMPHTKDWENQFKTFLKIAKDLGVSHFVKLSFCHSMIPKAETMTNFATATRTIDPFLQIPLVQMHRECDLELIKTNLPFGYTLLFASHFMSNPAVYQRQSIQNEHKLYGASKHHGANYVSPNDCAEVAIRALLHPKDHFRVGYTLTGPTALKDTQVAQLIGKTLGTSIQYVDQPLESFADLTQSTDWGPAVDVACLEYVKASGVEEESTFVSNDIFKTCGHAAESFQEYLEHPEFMTPQEKAYLVA